MGVRQARPADLPLWPRGDSVHFVPRQGEPQSLLEFYCQRCYRIVAWLPVYTALVATICLVLLVLDHR